MADKIATEPKVLSGEDNVITRRFFGHHYDLVDRYEISIPGMTMNILTLSWIQIRFYTGCD